jgi:5-dehydro-2-deoxygluconokinase
VFIWERPVGRSSRRRGGAAARRAGRDCVGCIVLGRHESDAKVELWLTNAAATRGFIGFAVGRATFWNPLVDYRAGRIARDFAVARIAAPYRGWVHTFEKAKAGAAVASSPG